jgi:CRISPR-associated protein Cas1
MLNTLFVTVPTAYLALENENVCVLVDGDVKLRVPLLNLEAIVQFGYPGASPALLGHCAEQKIMITFLTEHGRPLAQLVSPNPGNVHLRRQQYRLADDPERSARTAGIMITAKLLNAKTVLQRAQRDHPQETGDIEEAVRALAQLVQQAENASSAQALLGIEGEGARRYFDALPNLVLERKDFFQFTKRTRRPPLDPLNALLSFLYSLLAHEMQAALFSVGLDSAVGFLHRDRSGRQGLALDMMEELRPPFADRLALTLINRRQLVPKDFQTSESGAVLLRDDARKVILTAWQQRKQEPIVHPYLKEKIPFGLIPYAQALLMARHIRGDLDAYPPFFWR